MLDDFLIHVFHKGNTLEAYKVFGAHFETTDHKKGVRFTVYAPNARSVQVIFSLIPGINNVQIPPSVYFSI